MTNEDRKLLTEYLGECWHELPDNPLGEKEMGTCVKCRLFLGYIGTGWDWAVDDDVRIPHNRTFTIRADMMDLYDRLFQKHKWHKFTVFAKMRFSFNDYDQTFTNIETGFYAWLFCLSGEGYEDRCQMVANWVKEAK